MAYRAHVVTNKEQADPYAGSSPGADARHRARADLCRDDRGADFELKSILVIACDKREAFAQGSESEEAIQLSVMSRYGLLRFACNDG